jgi:acid phosphatase
MLILLVMVAAFVGLKYSHAASNPERQFVVKHVIVILLESKNESFVLGNKDAPYINNILVPNYSITDDYYSVAHPSLPNYIAITSGSTFGVRNNSLLVDSLPYKNIVDLLAEHDITWKAYMESIMTVNGSCGGAFLSEAKETYGYVSKHNPFAYYTDIMNNKTRCRQIVPLSQFSADLANNQLPGFSFITSNIMDDGHTAPPNATACAPSGTSLQCADNWLSRFLPPIINSPEFANTIVFITWDAHHESAPMNQTTTSPNNRVLLIAVSPDSREGYVDNTTFYSHYSLLATIERIYGLGNLGRNDSTANVLSNLFVNDTV